MKKLLLILFFYTFSFADYSLSYSGIKLGEIKTFKTVKNNYFKVKVTSSIAKFLLGYDYIVFYNNNYKEKRNNPDIKYKIDKYKIIDIFNVALYEEVKDKFTVNISDKKRIDIVKKEDYEFKYHSKGKIKTQGKFRITNNDLIFLEEYNNNILIEKMK